MNKKMTIKQLIRELRNYPLDTKVVSDDGTGWVGDKIYFQYDEDYQQLGIYARYEEDVNDEN